MLIEVFVSVFIVIQLKLHLRKLTAIILAGFSKFGLKLPSEASLISLKPLVLIIPVKNNSHQRGITFKVLLMGPEVMN